MISRKLIVGVAFAVVLACAAPSFAIDFRMTPNGSVVYERVSSDPVAASVYFVDGMAWQSEGDASAYIRANGMLYNASFSMPAIARSGFVCAPVGANTGVLVDCGGESWLFPIDMSSAWPAAYAARPVVVAPQGRFEVWLAGFVGYDSNWNAHTTYLRADPTAVDDLGSLTVLDVGAAAPPSAVASDVPVSVVATVVVSNEPTVSISNFPTGFGSSASASAAVASVYSTDFPMPVSVLGTAAVDPFGVIGLDPRAVMVLVSLVVTMGGAVLGFRLG